MPGRGSGPGSSAGLRCPGSQPTPLYLMQGRASQWPDSLSFPCSPGEGAGSWEVPSDWSPHTDPGTESQMDLQADMPKWVVCLLTRSPEFIPCLPSSFLLPLPMQVPRPAWAQTPHPLTCHISLVVPVCRSGSGCASAGL